MLSRWRVYAVYQPRHWHNKGENYVFYTQFRRSHDGQPIHVVRIIDPRVSTKDHETGLRRWLIIMLTEVTPARPPARPDGRDSLMRFHFLNVDFTTGKGKEQPRRLDSLESATDSTTGDSCTQCLQADANRNLSKIYWWVKFHNPDKISSTSSTQLFTKDRRGQWRRISSEPQMRRRAISSLDEHAET